MYDVIIFGGGIAGLTIAHELVKTNKKCLIVEKEDILGGMARSYNSKSLFPSEHSWRGYAPFYTNVFQIMKEIPFYDKTVFDNLSIPVNFFLMYDEIKPYSLATNILDDLILFYLGVLCLFSNNRYFSYKIEPFLRKYLSKQGYNYIINFIVGPGYGMDKDTLSMSHMMKFPIVSYVQNNYGSSRWQVTTGPTNEMWIDPWVDYLKKNNVEFMTKTELYCIKKDNNNTIKECVVNRSDTYKILKAKDYIMSINPYNSVNIFKRSNMLNLFNIFSNLTKETVCKQISFRIGLYRKLNYPIDNIAFVMNDSQFNLTWYPQEKYWEKKPNIDSLWSGTIIDFKTKGLLFDKTAEECNEKELKKEIIHQILRSKSFQNLIYEHNQICLEEKDISYFEIWYEWNFINGKQEQKSEKWVNNIYNQKYRPSQKTKYNNLYLSGAHTKTSIDIWSMESAVESGKLTANLLLKKYGKSMTILHKHEHNILIKFFKYIDDILYSCNLPHVLLCICVLFLIITYSKIKTI